MTLLVGSSCHLSPIAILFSKAVTSCVIFSISRDLVFGTKDTPFDNTDISF